MTALATRINAGIALGRTVAPGIVLASTVALASMFISEHYGAPAMLLALLLGIAMNFLSDDARCAPGIAFGARTVLRIGVALLGLRISFDMALDLGWPVVLLVIGGVFATIAFGMFIARFFGFGPRFAILSSGSVAICGASAALAIAAVLPQDKNSQDQLVFTVVGVTILSTLAMIIYPILGSFVAPTDTTIGIYLGATIHDVAQVVGAGFSVSETAGETATLVKLIRVAMLAPVVVIIALVVRSKVGAGAETMGASQPVVPFFLIGFIVLATLNSLIALPEAVTTLAADASRTLLLVAIAAVGLKTIPKDLLKVGKAAALLLVVETVFLATFTWIGLMMIGAI